MRKSNRSHKLNSESESKKLKDNADAMLVNNMISRLSLTPNQGKTFGGSRDMYAALGYKKSPTNADYLLRYERQDIARRIINAYPDATWSASNPIKVTDDVDTDVNSEFESAFLALEEKTKLFHYLNRLDKLSGLGRYAVLLVGVRDGLELSEPIGTVSGPDDILYLMPFSESNAVISSYDESPESERFGLPEMYNILIGGHSNTKATNRAVHHSRVIHVAEGALENDIFGTPRLEPVLNRLDDLEKVVGGSAEIFWLNGRGGLNVNVDKDTVIQDPQKAKDDIEAYSHNLTRTLYTQGMSVNPVDLSVHSPLEHAEIIFTTIVGTLAMPKRLFFGTERGELASSQDERNWANRVFERSVNFCEPSILRPVIELFMTIGALPRVEEYDVVWPTLVRLTEGEEADVAVKKSQAISNYVNSNGGDYIVPPRQFVEDILNMDYLSDDVSDDLAIERDQMESDSESDIET